MPSELAGLLLGLWVVLLVVHLARDQYSKWQDYKRIKRWSKHR